MDIHGSKPVIYMDRRTGKWRVGGGGVPPIARYDQWPTWNRAVIRLSYLYKNEMISKPEGHK